LPKKYVQALSKEAEAWAPIWLQHLPLCQIDSRVRLMDMYPDVMQVINVATPPPETLVTPSKAIELAEIANEEMAGAVNKYPKKSLSAVTKGVSWSIRVGLFCS
jgi:hypothetical protein